jgi:hypothetical protein
MAPAQRMIATAEILSGVAVLTNKSSNSLDTVDVYSQNVGGCPDGEACSRPGIREVSDCSDDAKSVRTVHQKAPIPVLSGRFMSAS